MSTDDRASGLAPGHDREPGDDPGHDAHLQAALRHAPDASVAAPASLREAILLQARIQARVGAPASRTVPTAVRATWWERIDHATRWLGRPAVAAGFASVAAATVIGLMWWDRPIDKLVAETMAPVSEGARTPAAAPESNGVSSTDSAPAALAAKPAANATPPFEAPSLAAPAVATPPRPAMVAPSAEKAAPSESTTPTRRNDEGSSRRRESSFDGVSRARELSSGDAIGQPRVADATGAMDAKVGAASERAKRSGETGHENVDRPGGTVAAAPVVTVPAAPSPATPLPAARQSAAPILAPVPSPSPAQAPTPAPMPAPSPVEPMQAKPMSAAPAATSAQPAAPANAAGHLSATAPAGPIDGAARRSASMASITADARATASPLSGIAAQLVDDSSRWTWRRDDGAPQPIDDRVTRWVQNFDRTSAGADRPSAASTTSASPTVADAPGEPKPVRPQAFPQDKEASIRIDLLRDGRLQATLRIEGNGALTVARPSAPISRSRAAPTSDALADLRARAPRPR